MDGVGADVRPGECRAYVQMFLSDDWPSRVYSVSLAKDQSIANTQAFGTFYVYVEKESGSRLVGEASPLDVTRTDFPLQPLKPVIKSA